MSREVPLMASEKIKLGILIFFGVMILVALLSDGWRAAYRAIVRDRKGYEAAVDDLEERYYFTIKGYSETLNNYQLNVEPRAWNSYDEANREKYCDAVYQAIRNAQVKYKMFDENVQPTIDFYVNNWFVGTVTGGITTIKP